MLKSTKMDHTSYKQKMIKKPKYINSKRQPTLTKVLVGGFTWPTFSGDCRKPDSSMQLEGVITGLSEKSVPAVLIKLEDGKVMVVESLSLPTPLRGDIPFCIRRDDGSILTPNRRWL